MQGLGAGVHRNEVLLAANITVEGIPKRVAEHKRHLWRGEGREPWREDFYFLSANWRKLAQTGAIREWEGDRENGWSIANELGPATVRAAT